MFLAVCQFLGFLFIFGMWYEDRKILVVFISNTYTYKYIDTKIYICIYIYMYTYLYTHLFKFVDFQSTSAFVALMYVCQCVDIHQNVYSTYIYICMYVCMYIYIYIYIYIYVFICICANFRVINDVKAVLTRAQK